MPSHTRILILHWSDPSASRAQASGVVLFSFLGGGWVRVWVWVVGWEGLRARLNGFEGWGLGLGSVEPGRWCCVWCVCVCVLRLCVCASVRVCVCAQRFQELGCNIAHTCGFLSCVCPPGQRHLCKGTCTSFGGVIL